jgi:hypothetical protein
MISKDQFSASDQDQPDDQDPSQPEGHISDETQPEGQQKVRRRIKVRKRIRIRKKPSVKKKMRKWGEKLLWFLIIAGFITALIVMVIELDIRDDRLKKREKAKPTLVK